MYCAAVCRSIAMAVCVFVPASDVLADEALPAEVESSAPGVVPVPDVTEAAVEGDAGEIGLELATDFSSVSRDELEQLAGRLALENVLLRDQEASDDASKEVQGESQTIEAVEAEIAELTLRIADLKNRLAVLGGATGDLVVQDVVGEQGDGDAQVERGGAVVAEVGKYEYRYEFGLIGRSGHARTLLRDAEGGYRSESYDYEEFRDDAVWVRILFRNQTDIPMRFSGQVALADSKPRGRNRSRVKIVGQTAFRTPVLEPGEIYEDDREVRVSDPKRVRYIELGRVRSYEQ
ncbi:MAG: hypothetical protein V3V20_09695 [Algisphaera sp.]